MNRQSPPTPMPEEADVVVVGGGIAGTSAAFHLASAGVNVTLLERGVVGGGTTSAAVGVLSPPVRQPFHETVRFRGEEAATRLWRFAERSIAGLADVLRKIGATGAAELDLSGGHVLAQPHTLHEVVDSFEALERAGLPVTWLSADDVNSLWDVANGFNGGFRIEGGGSIAPGAVAVSLAEAARDEGATILEEVGVTSVQRDGDGFVCSGPDGATRCRSVVHATAVASRAFSSFLRNEIVPIRAQGFQTEPIERVFEGSFSTHWKLNLWRQDASGRIVVGGWRHDAWNRAYGQDSAEIDPHLQDDLFHWFRRTFPDLKPMKVKHRWSGVFGWTADFLPLVGPIPDAPGEFVSSGFSGGGLPFAFESGRLIAALVKKQGAIEGAELFSPERFVRSPLHQHGRQS